MWSSNRMRYYHRLLTGLGEVFGFSMDTAWKDLPDDIQQKILYGTGDKITIKYTNRFGRKRQWQATFEGAIPSSTVVTSRPRVSRLGSTTRSTWRRFPARPAAAAGSIRSRLRSRLPIHVAEVSDLALGQAKEFFEDLKLSDRERPSPSAC